MNGLTLRQLRSFVVLMDQGHFGRAAQVCAISQPALSVQIKDMEHLLKADLFERGPKGVRPTAFATDLLPRVQDILRQIDQLGDLAPVSADGVPHRLRLGVIPTVAPYMLPRIVPHLAQSFPTMDLQVMEAMTPKLLTQLEAGHLDMALLALPIQNPDLAMVRLFTEPFVLVRAPQDADKPIPPAASLARERLLLLEEGHCFRDQALEYCGLQTASVRPGLDACNLSTLVQMVAAGLGITLIPNMAIPVETRGTDVSVTQFTGLQPKRDIGVIWRAQNPLADGFQKIATALAACAPDL